LNSVNGVSSQATVRTPHPNVKGFRAAVAGENAGIGRGKKTPGVSLRA
jgi:hypothetical protein